jgi:hypothetical protein
MRQPSGPTKAAGPSLPSPTAPSRVTAAANRQRLVPCLDDGPGVGALLPGTRGCVAAVTSRGLVCRMR